jgi:hypothetical protein
LYHVDLSQCVHGVSEASEVRAEGGRERSTTIDVDESSAFEGLAPSDGTESGCVYVWTGGECGREEKGMR